MFTLAHIADLHAPPVRIRWPGDVLNKRLSGWISWTLRRRYAFRREILEAGLADLQARRFDHVAVTGDLVNLALEEEFVAAAAWLERLGSPDRISVVPGNHEAYVAVPMDRSWDYLAEYMASDLATDPTRIAPGDFPTLRVRGDVALIGVCSARPSGLFSATGSLGPEQLRGLESLLHELRECGLCRIVQIHHPPIDIGLPRRRRLTDSKDLCEVLACAGAELVLHAHDHKSAFQSLQGPVGPIPVVGVRSISNGGNDSLELAQYHLYDIKERRTGEAASRYRITVQVREWSESSGAFVAAGQRLLTGSGDDERSRHARVAHRSAA